MDESTKAYKLQRAGRKVMWKQNNRGGHSIPEAAGDISGSAGLASADKSPEGGNASDRPADPSRTWPEFYSSCSQSVLPLSWRTAENDIINMKLSNTCITKKSEIRMRIRIRISSYLLGIVGAVLSVYFKVFTLRKQVRKTRF